MEPFATVAKTEQSQHSRTTGPTARIVVDHSTVATSPIVIIDGHEHKQEKVEEEEQTIVPTASALEPGSNLQLPVKLCISARLKRYAWRALLAVFCTFASLAVLVAQTLLGASLVDTERVIEYVKAQMYSIMAYNHNVGNKTTGNMESYGQQRHQQ